jgi:DnaJ-class molecular chaperone
VASRGVTHYERLDVARDATTEVIHDAYRSLARMLHPDQSAPGAVDPTAMASLNEAWFVLRDAGRRAAYDRTLGIEDPVASIDTSMSSRLDTTGGDDVLGAARLRKLRRLVAVTVVFVFVAAVVLTVIGIVGAGNRP